MVGLDLARRFLFVTGKGGVGKTSVVAALAERFARAGKRVLVAETSPKEHISSLFGRASLPTQITELSPRLYGVLLDADVALKEYGALVLKSERLVGALFDNKLVHGFFHGAPGLKEWAALGKAWYHSTELLADGSPRFDVVILDAPATGHGLDMLRVPKTIIELSPPGVLRTDAERAWAQFRDPQQSGVVVVTLPEEMPTNESIELCGALRSELTLPLLSLVVNQVVPTIFAPAERDALAELEEPAEQDAASLALGAGIRRAAREQVQSQSLERLAKLGVPLLKLPFLVEGATSLPAISKLVDALAASPVSSA
ncbi:MAG TPA: ArsA family ATPase [Polyangiaceae bacterium]|nr:ArsA family ATPase [Polyangiaceae bacterium]